MALTNAPASPEVAASALFRARLCNIIKLAIRTAPFGDVPSTEEPPFSAEQAASLISSKQHPGSFGDARLKMVAADALHAIEARTRDAIDRQLHLLASSACGPLPLSCGLAPMPSGVREVLIARFGPRSIQILMRTELCLASAPSVSVHDAILDAGAHAFEPLRRLAQRCAHWQALLGMEHARAECDECTKGRVDRSALHSEVAQIDRGGDDDDDDASAWPGSSAWQDLLERTAWACGPRALSGRDPLRRFSMWTLPSLSAATAAPSSGTIGQSTTLLLPHAPEHAGGAGNAAQGDASSPHDSAGLHCEVLSVEARTAGKRQRYGNGLATDDHAGAALGHWEVRVRLSRAIDVERDAQFTAPPSDDVPEEPSSDESAVGRQGGRGGGARARRPLLIHRVTIAETLSTAWPSAFASLPVELVRRVEDVATRDVYFAPPIELLTDHAAALLAIKLPRVRADMDVPAPVFRVAEIVCGAV